MGKFQIMHKVGRLDIKVLEHAVIGIIAGVSVQLTSINQNGKR